MHVDPDEEITLMAGQVGRVTADLEKCLTALYRIKQIRQDFMAGSVLERLTAIGKIADEAIGSVPGGSRYAG